MTGYAELRDEGPAGLGLVAAAKEQAGQPHQHTVACAVVSPRNRDPPRPTLRDDRVEGGLRAGTSRDVVGMTAAFELCVSHDARVMTIGCKEATVAHAAARASTADG